MGQSYTFRITTTGGFQPVTYTWQDKDGNPINPTDSYANGSELTLDQLQLTDSGEYTVTALDALTDGLVQSTVLSVGLGVPVAGLGGLIAIAGAMAAGGASLLRKRRR